MGFVHFYYTTYFINFQDTIFSIQDKMHFTQGNN